MSKSIDQLIAAAFKTESRSIATTFAIVIIIGVPLGLLLPPGGDYPEPWRTLSGLIGWIYFTAWSVSFWPQVIINYRRKSVVGLSFDYLYMNLLGFSCYSAFNLALYYNNDVRAEYQKQYNGALPSVQSNDVFFAVHAVLVTILIIVQTWIYERGGQRISYTALGIIIILLVSIVIVTLCVAFGAGSWFTWLNLLTYLSYVKLAISLMKYIPQAILNYRRKSTIGWSIENILLDFTGGALSVGQEIMDCAVSNDWSGISGDPVKFGLGSVSMIYDVIFMFQHYVFYRHSSKEEITASNSDLLEGEKEKLLA
jgi:cystinosin